MNVNCDTSSNGAIAISDFGSSKGSILSLGIKEKTDSAHLFKDTTLVNLLKNRNETSSEFFVENPDAIVTKKPFPSRNLKARFEVLQKWVGKVVDINSDEEEFTAEIVDKTDLNNPEELVVLNFEEVSPADSFLLSKGAIFSWTIGYEYRGTTKNKSSIIRFSRLKGFSEQSKKKAEIDTKSFLELLHAHI